LLNTSGDKQITITGFNGTVGLDYGGKSGSAKSVYRFTRNGEGEACKQQTHASHIAIVLTSLVGTTHNHVANLVCRDFRVLFHKATDGMGTQIIGTNR
jgi:hypothetical protein